jgi:nicotinate-nucleotide adenylyltransferase
VARLVGILGGTFDPVHNAHLAFADAALRTLDADRILWMPTGRTAYRKPAVASGPDRVAMLRLALQEDAQGDARHAIDERELAPGASGFTIDTVQALRAEQPGAEFVLLMGADQYEKRAGWHRWAELERLCTIAVAARPGWSAAGARAIAMTPLAISASDIRARLARGEDVSAMLPARVLDYIREKGLYR